MLEKLFRILGVSGKVRRIRHRRRVHSRMLWWNV